MSETKFTDPSLLDCYDRAAGLKWRKESETEYRVQSGRFPSLFYTVRLSEEGAACNCPAVAHCRHAALVMALAFPSLLTLWRVEAECAEIERQCEKDLEFIRQLREERHRAECEAFWGPLRPMLKARARELAAIRKADAEAAEILGTGVMAA